jgi:hypothetical protein
MTLLVVLYGRETLSLKLVEEYKMRVVENKVLRKMCRPQGDEILRGCRHLHDEKVRNPFCSRPALRLNEL